MSAVYARMVARDFRRNRTVTVLLVVLMMLSVLLATASAGTLTRLFGASSALMDRAQAPHVAQLHVGDYDAAAVDRWVASRPEVVHHQTMVMVGIDGAHLFFDGEDQSDNIQQNSLVVPNMERDLLLDLDNEPVLEVEPGTIVLPVLYDVRSDLEVGDVVTITAADGFRTDLTVAGFARDSTMNPAIASSKRLAVSPQDHAEVLAHTGAVEYLIEFWLADPSSDTGAFSAAYLDSDLPKNGQMVDSATFQILTMIGDGMVAAVIILVALLLLVVAMLCLRFSFRTAAEQDHREIGVLKAIGIPARDIKRMYLAKYAVLAATATVAGLLAGLALTPLLTRNITHFMGSASSAWAWVVPVLAALAVLAALLLFVRLLLRRFDKISPVVAMTTSPSVRRPRNPMRLHRSRTPVNLRLGVMDVVGRWPTYLLLVLVFAVSTFIMVVPTSSAATASSAGFSRYMGIGDADVLVNMRHSGDVTPDDVDSAVDHVTADPDVAAVAALVSTRHATLDEDGAATSLYVANGDHTQLPVTYAEGRAPTDESEIALSLLALNRAGRHVGESLPIEIAGQWRELSIVGSYQDITNGGTTAKAVLPTAGEEVMWSAIGISLVAGADAATVAAALTEELPFTTVADVEQWQGQTLGAIGGQLRFAAAISAVVAVLLAVLMTAMFTRMLLARDASQIAVQRAIGVDDTALRRQYLARTLIVLVAGVAVGVLASNTVGESMFNLAFEAMFGGFETLGQGTSQIAFDVDPLLTLLALPGALLAAVALATAAATRTVRATSISSLTTE